MFGIEFKKWDTPLWDPDVEAYEVFQSGKLIGRIYIDSHPRPGKYTHANAVPLRGGIPGKAVPMAAHQKNQGRFSEKSALIDALLQDYWEQLGDALDVCYQNGNNSRELEIIEQGVLKVEQVLGLPKGRFGQSNINSCWAKWMATTKLWRGSLPMKHSAIPI